MRVDPHLGRWTPSDRGSRRGCRAPTAESARASRCALILATHCYDCHDAKSKITLADVIGGLRVDSRVGYLDNGQSGPLLVMGKPEDTNR